MPMKSSVAKMDELLPLPGLQPVDLPKVVDEIERVGLKRWLLEELVESFREARKGKLRTVDQNAFELHWIENLLNLRDAILERRYKPGASVAFVVFDPMVREIFAAPFKDRAIHHFLYRMQAGWWDRHFIANSFSCRVGKGTQRATLCCQRHMRSVTKGGTKPARCAKLDIQGYFMSLPRERLFERVKWGLERQFECVAERPLGHQLMEICEYLWKIVLFDDPVEKAWKRGKLCHWNPHTLPPSKSLFCQPPGYGIVIGNLTSQLVSNIYLDLLDRYVTIELGYRYYARYVDDFYIMVAEGDWPQLSRDIVRIERFLKDEMELTLHPKKRSVQSVYKGVSFVGARVYANCLFPSNRLQSRFPRALRELLHEDGELESVIAYLGIMRHQNSYKYIQKTFVEMGIN